MMALMNALKSMPLSVPGTGMVRSATDYDTGTSGNPGIQYEIERSFGRAGRTPTNPGGIRPVLDRPREAWGVYSPGVPRLQWRQ